MLAFKQIVIIFVLFYSTLLLYLYLQQKTFIFFPTRTKHNLSDNTAREFTFAREGVRLHGWLLNHKFASKRLILYYGGNAEDVFYAADQFKLYGDTSTLLMNYRGYGRSEGNPGEMELFADALAIFDEIQKQYSPQHVFLMGRSLGSGVAAYIAAQRKVSGIILITPFDSIENLAKRQFPFLPISLLLRHKFLSVDYASQFSAPCLVLYGGKDRTVPPQFTEKLLKKISVDYTAIYVQEAEHNNIELFDEYNLAILKFLEET